MSRTETGASEKVQRSIHITIMRHLALTARPASYSKVCDTFRPRRRHRAARRTDLGGESLLDFRVPRAMLNSLVREHLTETRPAGIEDGLGHAGPGKSCGRDVTDCDVIKLPHDAARGFPVPDLSFRQGSRVEHAEGVPRKAEGIAPALQIAFLERHPGQRFLSAVSQVRAPMLAAAVGVLFAHGIHGARMQPQLLAAASSEDVQVKATRPFLPPLEGMFLRVVTEVPYEVDCSALSIQRTGQGFHAVAEGQQHTVYITRYRNLVNQPRRQRFLPGPEGRAFALKNG